MPKNKKLKSNKISGIAQLGTLMEHVDEKVTLVAEGVSVLNTRMDRVERTLNHQTEMIGDLAVNLEVVKADVEFMKGALKRKVDAEEFEALEKRVASLESRLARH